MLRGEVESGYAAPHQDTQELSALESVGHPVREPFVHRLRCMNGYLHFEVARPPVVEQGYDATLHVMKCLLRRGYAGRRLAPSLRPRIHDLIYHLTPRELLPYDLYRLYFRVRAATRARRRNLVVYNHCEQVPDPDSRITLE